ncbi:MAG: T9SS type A sorting domain-containing protein, partial [Candidatus Krumholzibacteria bacterium]|nr:T9SS type A sorting domain-containing protein [Candidatus Krumholzibacteria bacterium]
NFVELDDPEIVANGLSYTFVDPDIEPGLSYRYIVEVLDEDGHRTLFETGLISAPGLAVELREVFPNPFNPQTTIVYTTSKIGPVTLGIYDARGRRIRLLVDEPRGAGEHTETWYGLNQNGETVASGVYFVRLETNGVVRTAKAVLSK